MIIIFFTYYCRHILPHILYMCAMLFNSFRKYGFQYAEYYKKIYFWNPDEETVVVHFSFWIITSRKFLYRFLLLCYILYSYFLFPILQVPQPHVRKDWNSEQKKKNTIYNETPYKTDKKSVGVIKSTTYPCVKNAWNQFPREMVTSYHSCLQHCLLNFHIRK